MKPHQSPRNINTPYNNTTFNPQSQKSSRPFTSNRSTHYYSSNKKSTQGKNQFPTIYSQNNRNNNVRYSQDQPQPYWEREKLFDRCIKLQNSVNILDRKIKIAKIEQTKQKQEILKQNKILNEYNEKINRVDNNTFPEEESKGMSIDKKKKSKDRKSVV